MESKKASVISTVILAVFAAFCILPILLVITISITSQKGIVADGYSLLPRSISFEAYKMIFANPGQLIHSYFITIIVTVLGTFFSMLISSMLAYVISRKDYPLANKTSFYIFFTMLFSGGLVPWYILISRTFHMSNTIFALFVPYLVTPWFVLLMKGFLSTTPFSIIESAKIDGCSEYRIFFRIILPINKPGLATVGLFSVLMFWNDYWLSLLFIDNNKLYTLQFLLYRIMSNLTFLNSSLGVNAGVGAGANLPSESARMAMCLLAAGPMLFVFPFFQRFFVKGLTVGAVKG
ncbi:MAG: carbohydrate ABC transporter permease [Firmicutes bacterium]|nr:carbohydrate ABC transporter permease [Bacillota bacterium]